MKLKTSSTVFGFGGLGLAAISYIGIDYLRHVSPIWHERLQPPLWVVLALASLARAPFYTHWSSELRFALPFIASMLFMLLTLLIESFSVRFVTVYSVSIGTGAYLHFV